VRLSKACSQALRGGARGFVAATPRTESGDECRAPHPLSMYAPKIAACREQQRPWAVRIPIPQMQTFKPVDGQCSASR
jgi:hypothetical protein